MILYHNKIYDAISLDVTKQLKMITMSRFTIMNDKKVSYQFIHMYKYVPPAIKIDFCGNRFGIRSRVGSDLGIAALWRAQQHKAKT